MPHIEPAWRQQLLGASRIAFGVVWAIDAQFKWRPAFLFHFASYLTDAQAGQPAWVKGWIQLWLNVINISPVGFAVIVALLETALAVALLLGVMTNLTCWVGAVFALVIWATAEGFGGPYTVGATDIGTSIIYAMVFVMLYLSNAGNYLGLDGKLMPHLGKYAWLASDKA